MTQVPPVEVTQPSAPVETASAPASNPPPTSTGGLKHYTMDEILNITSDHAEFLRLVKEGFEKSKKAEKRGGEGGIAEEQGADLVEGEEDE